MSCFNRGRASFRRNDAALAAAELALHVENVTLATGGQTFRPSDAPFFCVIPSVIKLIGETYTNRGILVQLCQFLF